MKALNRVELYARSRKGVRKINVFCAMPAPCRERGENDLANKWKVETVPPVVAPSPVNRVSRGTTFSSATNRSKSVGELGGLGY
jgi:hypothetical protein